MQQRNLESGKPDRNRERNLQVFWNNQDIFGILNSFSLLNEFWGSRGCSQMVVFIGASSLSHSIDRYSNIKRRLGRRIKATTGLSFNPQADREKQVRHIL